MLRRPSIGFGIVEFAFVETLHDLDSIRVNPFPSQSCHLSDPQRTNYDRHNDGSCWFAQRLDHTAYFSKQPLISRRSTSATVGAIR